MSLCLGEGGGPVAQVWGGAVRALKAVVKATAQSVLASWCRRRVTLAGSAQRGGVGAAAERQEAAGRRPESARKCGNVSGRRGRWHRFPDLPLLPRAVILDT